MVRGCGIAAVLAAAVLVSAIGISDGAGGKGGGRATCPSNLLLIVKQNVKVCPYPIPDKISGVPMTRHHIIPKNMLIEFFNKVVHYDCNHPGSLAQLANALKKLAVYGKDHKFNPGVQLLPHEIEQLKKELKRNPTQDEKNSRYYEIALQTAVKIEKKIIVGATPPKDKDSADVRGMRLLKHLYVWNPYNIFIGPTKRSDDPKNGFETKAKYLIGHNNFVILESIYKLMHDYVHAHTNDSRKLAEIGRKLADIVKQNSGNPNHAYGYDASRWINHKGTYSIKKPQPQPPASGPKGNSVRRRGHA